MACKPSHDPADRAAPVSAVLDRAVGMGLMTADTHQVGAHLPTGLLEQAKRRTGIASTTDLLTFALATVAVEDDFAKAFVAARGRLDPDLDIGFQSDIRLLKPSPPSHPMNAVTISPSLDMTPMIQNDRMRLFRGIATKLE